MSHQPTLLKALFELICIDMVPIRITEEDCKIIMSVYLSSDDSMRPKKWALPD
jgi:hypothetical protein